MEHEVEVMRVWRVPPLGRLQVEAGGQRYETLSAAGEAAGRQLLMAAIGELVEFAGGYHVLVDAGVAPPIRPAAAAPPPLQTPPAPGADAARQQRFMHTLEHDRDAALQSAHMRGQSGGLLRRVRAPEAAAVDIVAQIEALLQLQVAADPGLSGRAIHMRSGADGRPRIEVDGRAYERPDQVEDPAVRRAIDAALKAWEAR